MNTDVHDLIRKAARLTGLGRLREATQTLRQALAPHARGAGTGAAPADRPAPTPGAADVIDDCVREVFGTPQAAPVASAEAPVREAERWIDGHHTHAGSGRDYKLFLPAGRPGMARPLLVLLHGCTQDADDFARGTGMNHLAQEHGLAVLYPQQSAHANPGRCWNWFKHSHQARGRGEAGLIATLTRRVQEEHGLDAGRVYVAGLSAGGAMAAVLALAYPELYAAAGVHSGLAPGLAHDLPAALAAMKGPSGAEALALPCPLIVFQGDADTTVHPSNGEQLVAAGRRPAAQTVEHGVSAGGRRFQRRVYAAAPGRPAAEYWQVHGAGHAWAGGSAEGSYTDPQGPQASREMLRFFLSQPAADA